MTKADLGELAARVEAGSGPDRGLDGRIAWALGWRFDGLEAGINDPEFDQWSDFGGRWAEPGDSIDDNYDSGHAPEPPEWTSSLDAVVALIEERLPGWGYQLIFSPRVVSQWPCRAELTEPIETNFGPGVGIRSQVTAPSAPRALLASCLRALAAQQDRQTEG